MRRKEREERIELAAIYTRQISLNCGLSELWSSAKVAVLTASRHLQAQPSRTCAISQLARLRISQGSGSITWSLKKSGKTDADLAESVSETASLTSQWARKRACSRCVNTLVVAECPSCCATSRPAEARSPVTSEGALSPRNEDNVDDDLLLSLIYCASVILDALHDQVCLCGEGASAGSRVESCQDERETHRSSQPGGALVVSVTRSRWTRLASQKLPLFLQHYPVEG